MRRPSEHLRDDHSKTVTSVNVSVEPWCRTSLANETDAAAAVIQTAALAIRSPEPASTLATAENAPSRELLPAEATTAVSEEETLATLSPTTNEIEAAVATTTSAPRRKLLQAEAATVIRPMIPTTWLPDGYERDCRARAPRQQQPPGRR